MDDHDDELSAGDRVKRIRLMWGALCCSPVLYLGVAQLVQSAYFGPSGHAGIFGPPLPNLSVWGDAAIGLACVLQVALSGTAWVFGRRLAAAPPGSPARADILRRRLFAMAMLSETVVLAGFVVFLLGGGLQWVFYLGIVAFADYAASYPPDI